MAGEELMATKRTPIYRAPQQRITPEAIAAYKALRELEDDDVSRDSREFHDASLALHRALGRKPWDVFIDWIDVDSVPKPNLEPGLRASFLEAVELRRQLEEFCD
jgi:hypothetical protein